VDQRYENDSREQDEIFEIVRPFLHLRGVDSGIQEQKSNTIVGICTTNSLFLTLEHHCGALEHRCSPARATMSIMNTLQPVQMGEDHR
jgi:hypothetical protein